MKAAIPINGDEIFGAPRTVPRVQTSSTWPRPLGAAAYHGPFGEIVRHLAPETEADPAAILLQLLTYFGNVIGRGAYFQVGADRHHLNLYAAVVGDTAKGRKGLSNGRAVQVFEQVDPTWAKNCHTGGLSSGEGLIWQVRDAIERQQPIKEHGRVVDYQVVTEDPGITDKRLIVVEAEMASTLKVMSREGNTLSPIIRHAWDGRDLRSLTKASPAHATAPHISLICMITRDELRRYLEMTEALNGFGNRFLWVCSKRSRLLPDGGKSVDLERHVSVLQAAVAHGQTVGELRRDGAASRRWHQIYEQLSAGRPGMLGAMTARAEAQTMRLACLYAVGDMSYVVQLRHLEAAIEVWHYCFRSAKNLFGDRLGDPVADDILQALRACYPDSMTRTSISYELFKRNKSASEINRAQKLLTDRRLITVEMDDSGEGKAVERWAFTGNDIDDIDDTTPLISSISSLSSGQKEAGDVEPF